MAVELQKRRNIRKGISRGSASTNTGKYPAVELGCNQLYSIVLEYRQYPIIGDAYKRYILTLYIAKECAAS